MIISEESRAVACVTPRKVESVFATLVRAFTSNPTARWMYPGAQHYRLYFPQFVRAVARKAASIGGAWQVDHFHGAALCLPAGTGIGRLALNRLVAKTVEPTRLHAVLAVLDQIEIAQPKTPFWDLTLMGVNPDHQGRGLGTALVQAALESVDQQGSAMYVTAWDASHVTFFERFGFHQHGEIQAGDSPHIYAMIRPARARRSFVARGNPSREGDAWRSLPLPVPLGRLATPDRAPLRSPGVAPMGR